MNKLRTKYETETKAIDRAYTTKMNSINHCSMSNRNLAGNIKKLNEEKCFEESQIECS